MTTDVLPGVTVNVAAQAAPSGQATGTGRLLVPGITPKGPIDPTRVTGWASFTRIFGDRTHYSTLHDALYAFWAVGGGEAYVARVVGPAAATASVTLADAELTDTLEIGARDPGDHGDTLTVDVVDEGDTFALVIGEDGVQVERFSRLATPSDAVDRLASSRYVRATDLASGSEDPTPVAGTFDLAGGDDDRAGIGDADWAAALDRFTADYGPGQVAAPGRESDAARAQLVDHAEATRRTAYLDAPQGDNAETLTTLAGELDSRHAALFAPWLDTTIDGRVRAVPASTVAAGLTARLDTEAPTAHLSPDLARSALDAIVDVDVDFTDAEHAQLNGAGVNVFRTTRTSGVLLRGWRTTSDEDAWTQLSQARYVMGLTSRLATLAERFVFRTLTAATITDFGNALKAELKDDFDAGALYGADPDDAYAVDVSEDVNPPDEIAAGRLHGLVAVQVSPYAERVVLDVVKTAIA